MLVRLDRAFPGSVSKSMLNVHLFFVKQFGCRIVENNISINIEPFAQSIVQSIPHPRVWLSFGTGLHYPSMKHVGCSPVEAVQLADRVAYASWFYVVDKVAVNVMYSEPGEQRRGLVHAWHPSINSKHVHIVGQ